MSTTKITQRTIADAIAPQNRAVALRVGRWAKQGLLGKSPNPGTGNHREFDLHAIERARVLNLLTDLGVDIGRKMKLADVVLADHRARSSLEHLRNML